VNFQIEVAYRSAELDPAGRAASADVAAFGFAGVKSVRFSAVTIVETAHARADVERLARELLADPVVNEFRVRADGERVFPERDGRRAIEIYRRPGVMDPSESSVLRAAAAMGIRLESARSGRRYEFDGDGLSGERLRAIARRVLANEVIEEIHVGGLTDLARRPHAPYAFRKVTVPVRDLSDDDLARTSREWRLALSLDEMKAVRARFREIGREPTDAEILSIAQTWSEHCKHKTFTSPVECEGRRYENLLAETIVRATREIAHPMCVSVFVDNAGVVDFDGERCLAFKVETHNHPSAIEPYGGAGTGVGGVIRDVLGTGLGAKPLVNTDVFCFAPPDMPDAKVPKGALPPRLVMRGVVAGVRDYGNRMGIPTANGAIHFDERYVGNPLVYCGTVGILPRSKVEKGARKGDRVVMIGGRTGRDGIGGATFSSVKLDAESEAVSSGAVQIGNAIEEKKVLDVVLEARDRGLMTSITDCGAGGLSSAVGEMGEALGAEVHLELVPLKYAGLSYAEIWLSEAQERMVLAVPPEKVEELRAIAAEKDVEMTDLGRFTGDSRMRLLYSGEAVMDLDMEFLHHGLPRRRRRAVVERPDLEPFLPSDEDHPARLLRVLSSLDVCGKETVIRQYDHEVQGASALKPLVGQALDGPGDACIVVPPGSKRRGFAVGCGINPHYGDLDPGAMASLAIDEALRNVVAVGGDPGRTFILDNFCWGNTEREETLGSLVLAAEACYRTALAFGTPFISGKDSLHNEFDAGDRVIAIPPTLLVSALSIVEDVESAVSMDLKSAGDALYVLGLTDDELGGSRYLALFGRLGDSVPRVDLERAPRILRALARAIREGLVRACHDCSDGGLAAAAAEMAFAGGLGLSIDLARVPTRGGHPFRDDVVLFSESPTRFLLEVEPARAAALEKALSGLPCARIGQTREDERFVVTGRSGAVRVDLSIEELREEWKRPLRNL